MNSKILLEGEISMKFGYTFLDQYPNEPLYCANDLMVFLRSHLYSLCTVDSSVLLPNMYKMVQGTLYVTEVGLKHAFSAVVGAHAQSIPSCRSGPLGKFANGFLKSSLDNVLKKH